MCEGAPRQYASNIRPNLTDTSGFSISALRSQILRNISIRLQVNVLMFKKILLTSTIRNILSRVRRRCMLTLGFEGLYAENKVHLIGDDAVQLPEKPKQSMTKVLILKSSSE